MFAVRLQLMMMMIYYKNSVSKIKTKELLPPCQTKNVSNPGISTISTGKHFDFCLVRVGVAEVFVEVT